MNQQKVLIIKVGHSETLDPEISEVTSYGDVLRSTVLLNLYEKEHVTWLVDDKAYPILKNNPMIDRILIYNLSSVLQLQDEHFDTVINLEKVPGLCALADRVKAWQRYGFRFDPIEGVAQAYPGTQNAMKLCLDERRKKNNQTSWQEHLFEMVGQQWQGESYVFGFSPNTDCTYDVGLNYQVGNKWPTKSWPMNNWQQLAKKFKGQVSFSWQQGLDNMEDYFHWINDCRVIVTNDSFGLHLAIALKKQVVGIFGPTNPLEVDFYGKGKVFMSDGGCPHWPCYAKQCLHSSFCMEDISVEEVHEEVLQTLGVLV